MELFVSDLDGTLLNSNKEVSDTSKTLLNDLIDKGMKFTIATARTPATVVDILKDINIKYPAVMMNGVIIYNITDEKYIKIFDMEESVVLKILEVFYKYNKNPLVYSIKDDYLNVYYKGDLNSYEYDYYLERKDKKLKKFIQIDDYKESLKKHKTINFIALDDYFIIKNIYEDLKKIDGITCEYHKDIYGDGHYFLEVYSNNASKANAIEYLKDIFGYSKLIVFGDNLNDIPIFNISDECYAVENAVSEVKNIATDIINSNNDNGVAMFLKNRINLLF